MTTRRNMICSLSAAIALAPRAVAIDAAFPGKPNADTPVANLIPGKPPVLDFGDGLRVPCDKTAFLALWEGKTFWLTLGFGRSSYAQQAQGRAVKYAYGAMELLLITLAFAPDRMTKGDGGWRMKPGLERNWVRGDVALPGKPFWPVTDANLGFGNLDDPNLRSSDTFGGQSVDPGASFQKVDAFTSYLVLKRDLSLDDVRARAQIVLQ